MQKKSVLCQLINIPLNMMDFSRACISQISIHKIEPNLKDIWFSKQPVGLLKDEHNKKITAVLLKGFNMEAPYEFSKIKINSTHHTQHLIGQFFNDSYDFHEITKDLTEKFASIVPEEKKQEGEFIVSVFHDIIINGQSNIGLGIFKTSTKEKFIQLKRSGLTYSITIAEGINPRGLEESVLILQAPSDHGLNVYFKKNNYDFSSHYFIDHFLNAQPVQNNFFNTANHLNILKSYFEDELENEDPLEKIDKMNRSVEYFKNHDNFNSQEYESAIFENPEHIAAFEKFRNNYAQDKNIEIVDEFEISSNAIKKNNRYIRSVIKLDKNFHIYVHGNRQNIVRGYDSEKGMFYYQLFFEEET